MEDQPKRSATHNHTWGVASVEEPRWPATVAVVAAVILYLSLPDRFTLAMGVVVPGSYRIPLNWLLPAFELILLVPLSIRAPHRKQDEPPWQRRGAVAIIAAINVANFYSLFLLVGALISGQGDYPAVDWPPTIFVSYGNLADQCAGIRPMVLGA